jgi:three-Cys-motif partner protein
MTWNKNNAVNEPIGDNWGGPWTERKLIAFAKYVKSYLTIMNKYSFKTIYFDGFAGSGTKRKEAKTELLIQLKLDDEEEITYKGAAERILNLSDSFDYYYFIDKDDSSLNKLENKLKKNIDLTNKKIIYRSGDANKWILELSRFLKAKQDYAALVFLDPFGMQIDWSSIESLKGTRSDVWILVPAGVIVNRLLEKSGELKNIKKLESFFGLPEKEIHDIFYKTKVVDTFFGEEETTGKISNPIDKIAKLYAARMETIWTHVTKEPLRLYNSRGVPIFHFVFASNKTSALKIAKHIIKVI